MARHDLLPLLPPSSRGKLIVNIKSHFTQDKVRAWREEAVEKGMVPVVTRVFGAMQGVPGVGRLAAHATVNYWVSGVFVFWVWRVSSDVLLLAGFDRINWIRLS